MNLSIFFFKFWNYKALFFLVFLLVPVTVHGQEKELEQSIFITANTGLSQNSSEVLEQIAQASQNLEDASLLLVGNVVRDSFSFSEKNQYKTKNFLQQDLLQPLSNFNGKIIIAPGVNEWKEGPEGIEKLESYLQDEAELEFWPSDGCGIEGESLGDQVALILVDSQWYLENWDDHPKMNSDCEIKTRADFFAEFKDELKDNWGKTKIVAIHHPVLSNTRFGFFNRIGSLSVQAFENDKQNELKGRLETLASQFDDVIFVSGNHRNLQFLRNERNPQIISGAASKTEAVKAAKEDFFSSEEKGFAKLEVYEDGSSKIFFYEITENGPKLLYEHIIERELTTLDEVSFPSRKGFSQTQKASIYTEEETDKSAFYEFLWGEHYRDIYSRKIEAPVLFLDELEGNVKPISEGGGQQSRSIRLINDNKNEYTLRALRKSAERYLQADIMPQNYIREFIDSTVVERYVQDFFTTAHPYAPFAIGNLLDAINIDHANPGIFYVPKQERLGVFNDEYGGELYMLEEHVGDENKNLETFGSPDDILSTKDMLLAVRESKDAYVNEDLYIRARLFDMLVGDYDRHQDQWRWAEFEQEDGSKIYKPIPRDRDQAFPNYDGPILNILQHAVPLLRKMQPYEAYVEDPKWFNWSGYPLDKSFINESKWEDWQEQISFIQENLNDEQIQAAFEVLPEEAQDESIERIKKVLKQRLENLEVIAREYYNYLNDFETILGTEEDDVFEIIRQENGITKITISSDGKEIFSNFYKAEETEDIWIYGLSGEDKFLVKGKGESLIDLKVLGGIDKDLYDFQNTEDVKLYDYESTENTIINPESDKWLVDSYEINSYDYRKRKYSVNKILPQVDFMPDAGFTLGIKDVYTTYGLANNPFRTQHTLEANYYMATHGYGLAYTGEFAHIFYNWNLGIEAAYTSPNYFINFFGVGNDSNYYKDDVERSYNRVKMEKWHFAPALIWRQEGPGSFYFKPLIESIDVQYDDDDFIGQFYDVENEIFDSQVYAGAEVNYHYNNKNNPSFPSLGMQVNFTTGYKENIDAHDNQFGYIEPSFSVDYPLIESGFAVIATKIGGKVIFGDNYEFYHAATLGGNNSLRGYRNHRFNGESAFYHSTDLRSAFALVRTEFVPLILGISAGFDYGRVWSDNDLTEEWHSNYGGGVWINTFFALTGNVGLYHGDDGYRLAFTLNFKY